MKEGVLNLLLPDVCHLLSTGSDDTAPSVTVAGTGSATYASAGWRNPPGGGSGTLELLAVSVSVRFLLVCGGGGT